MFCSGSVCSQTFRLSSDFTVIIRVLIQDGTERMVRTLVAGCASTIVLINFRIIIVVGMTLHFHD